MTIGTAVQEKHVLPGNYTILVVDDEPSIREFMLMMLEHSGYTVIKAANGCEALMLISHHAIDLVVTDIHMPHMDGIELADRLQQAYPTIKLMFVTADPQSVQGNGYDTVPLLSKPFDPDTLVRSVQMIFEP